MAVYKRNKKWYVYFYVVQNGKRKKKGVPAGTRKDEAEALDKQIKQWLKNGIDPLVMMNNTKKPLPYNLANDVHDDMTLEKFFPMFMELHGKKQSKSMQQSYRSSLKHMLPIFRNYRLCEIKKLHVHSYMVNRVNEGASNATVNREVAFIKVMLQRATDWDILLANPLHGLDKLKEAPIRERYLSEDEYRRLLAVSPGYLKEIIIFALGTGCRKSEIFNLKWNDVNIDNRFKAGIITVVGKGGKRRSIHLNVTTYNLLKEKYRHRKSEYVFPSPITGTKLDNVAKSFCTALRRAGISNFRFHDLRHTAASWMMQNGANIYAVKEILGHADVKTTQRYAHQSPEYLGSQVSKLDRFLQIDETPNADDGDLHAAS